MVYQLTPTLLDAMVLAIAEGEDAYGYMIDQGRERPGMDYSGRYG